MPRLPKPRGFDIRDEDADCYDATGRFSHLTPSADDEPDTAAGEPEAAVSPSTEDGATEPVDRDAPFRRRGWLPWAAGMLALAVLLAVVLTTRGQDRQPTPSTLRRAPATAQPAPAPAVASPASGARRLSERSPRTRPARRRSRPRPVRGTPAQPVAVAAPRPVRPPAAPVRRPAPRPEPAGGEFILGAR